ncbi:MAG: hypothetical protein HYU27_06750 [Acidobacteria bacterium]|nr:hypothetical protein [Acidobacteriota bacterium]
MKSRLLILTFVAALASGASAYAHHSFAGTYQEGQVVTLEGTVAEFNIRNPHSFISIEVTDKNGKVTRWGGEWGGVTQLSQGGVNRFTLKIGDKIIIEGAPPRDSSDNKILVRKVVRPATAISPEFTWQGRVQ